MSRWLITGCSTGFGREIARAALQDGHQVVVTARSRDAVADLADEQGAAHHAGAADANVQGLNHAGIVGAGHNAASLQQGKPVTPPSPDISARIARLFRRAAG